MSKTLLNRVEELVLENSKLKAELSNRDSVKVESLKFDQLRLQNEALLRDLNKSNENFRILQEVYTKLLDKTNFPEMNKKPTLTTPELKRHFLGDPVKPSRFMEEIQKMMKENDPGHNKFLTDHMTAATYVSPYEQPTKTALNILEKFADKLNAVVNGGNVLSESVGNLATIAEDEKQLEYFSKKLEAFNNEKSKRANILVNKKPVKSIKSVKRKAAFKKSGI